MTKRDIEIDSRLNELELLTRKAKVISEDLTGDYFDQHVENISDTWKIAGVYYEAAGLKAGIVNDFLFELINKVVELQELIKISKKGGC